MWDVEASVATTMLADSLLDSTKAVQEADSNSKPYCPSIFAGGLLSCKKKSWCCTAVQLHTFWYATWMTVYAGVQHGASHPLLDVQGDFVDADDAGNALWRFDMQAEGCAVVYEAICEVFGNAVCRWTCIF